MSGCLRWIWQYKNYLLIVLTPLVLLPLPLVLPGPEVKCGYAIILMAVYWCTECLPLAVTALLPVIMFPMMGIMESSEVCVQYMNDSNMMFIGGLLVAIAVEHWNLHKRMAFRALLLVGVKPACLLMGFMAITAFLSMWINNTATTAMMLPIAHGVLQQLSAMEGQADERDCSKMSQENRAFELDDATQNHRGNELKSQEDAIGIVADVENLDLKQGRVKRELKYLDLSKAIRLSVCYAASIGGTATLTGTTPNVILKGQIDELFPGNGNIINFVSWFCFSFPNMLLMLVFSWLWLHFMYLGFNMKKSFGCGKRSANDCETYQVMKEEYKKLGSMSFAEGSVLVIFVLMVILWFTREPGFMPGWAIKLFNKEKSYVTDGTVAIFMSSLFFCIPSELPRFSGKHTNGKACNAPPALLTWDTVHEKMPWSIILLLGGGFVLARGCVTSGLSVLLGESLTPLQSIPPFAISILLCLLVTMFTEFSSNAATTSLFLPILASMATAIKLHPLYIMLPCTLCASMAFMLPVSTPPNAIVFSSGNLKVMDMVKAGFILNVLGIITINIALNTWGTTMFNLNNFPEWANVTITIP
ncbi:unnamed protein product [Lota lota]